MTQESKQAYNHPSYLPGDPFIVPHMKSRTKRGFTNLVLVDGPTRWGKSRSCLILGCVNDPYFDETRIFHKVKQLLLALNEPGYPGKSFVLEEGGKAASNEEWYKHANKVLGWVAQSGAYKNYNLFVNTTNDSTFTKKPREEINLILEGSETLRRGEFFVKLPFKKHTTKLGQTVIYKRFPRIKLNDVETLMKTYKFPSRLPPSIEGVWQQYLKMKDDDFSASMEDWISELDQEEMEEENEMLKAQINNARLKKQLVKEKYGKRQQSPKQLANLKHSGKKYKEALEDK